MEMALKSSMVPLCADPLRMGCASAPLMRSGSRPSAWNLTKSGWCKRAISRGALASTAGWT
eukprot:6325117-Lingulodinium_polyedra.AAC.1